VGLFLYRLRNDVLFEIRTPVKIMRSAHRVEKNTRVERELHTPASSA